MKNKKPKNVSLKKCWLPYMATDFFHFDSFHLYEYNPEWREIKNSSQAAIQVIQSSGYDDESLCQRIAIFCLRCFHVVFPCLNIYS